MLTAVPRPRNSNAAGLKLAGSSKCGQWRTSVISKISDSGISRATVRAVLWYSPWSLPDATIIVGAAMVAHLSSGIRLRSRASASCRINRCSIEVRVSSRR